VLGLNFVLAFDRAGEGGPCASARLFILFFEVGNFHSINQRTETGL
jgi:hypothetical protein